MAYDVEQTFYDVPLWLANGVSRKGQINEPIGDGIKKVSKAAFPVERKNNAVGNLYYEVWNAVSNTMLGQSLPFNVATLPNDVITWVEIDFNPPLLIPLSDALHVWVLCAHYEGIIPAALWLWISNSDVKAGEWEVYKNDDIDTWHDDAGRTRDCAYGFNWALVVLPTVATDPATAIGTVSATLNGTLTDGGGEACDCGFEWGETIAYGNITPTQSKTTGQTFAQIIGGLNPNKTYHFRAFATNAAGTSYGADRTFTTLVAVPVVVTNPATAISYATAILNGELSYDGGEACDCGFEWGDTPAYGTTTPIQSRIGGQIFSEGLSGLSLSTTYYFRAFATNSAGTSYGAGRSFTTSVPLSPAAIGVMTLAATLITNHSARLNGVVTDDAGQMGDVRFQYGLSTEYGMNTIWVKGYVKGNYFFADLADLMEGGAFHFRAQFRNQYGLVSGNDMVFSTPSPLGPVTLIQDELLYLLEGV